MKLSIRKDVYVADFGEDGNVVLEYLPACRDWPIPVRQLLGEVFG